MALVSTPLFASLKPVPCRSMCGWIGKPIPAFTQRNPEKEKRPDLRNDRALPVAQREKRKGSASLAPSPRAKREERASPRRERAGRNHINAEMWRKRVSRDTALCRKKKPRIRR